jgi:hypothetical protein
MNDLNDKTDSTSHPSEWADLRCPRCGSGEIALILYGLPEGHRDRTVRQYPEKYFFGGCSIDLEDCPKWYCNQCRVRWGPGAKTRVHGTGWNTHHH